MKILKIILISVNLISYNCYALDLSDLGIKALKKNDPAPYDGLLLDKKKANEFKDKLVELDKTKEINKSLEESNKLSKSTIDQVQDKNEQLNKRNDELARDLKDSRQMSDVQKILWFGLGIVGASAAVYGASKLK